MSDLARLVAALIPLLSCVACGPPRPTVLDGSDLMDPPSLGSIPDTDAARRALRGGPLPDPLPDPFPSALGEGQRRDRDHVRHALADARLRHGTLVEFRRELNEEGDAEVTSPGLTARIDRLATLIAELEALEANRSGQDR